MKKIICAAIVIIMTLGLLPSISIAAPPVRITVDSTDISPLGAFDGWGTSLCWWAETLGDETEAERMKMSKAFFDLEEGLGLNIVRFNIGAGDDPEHNHLNNGHDMRGLPVWEDENGNFDPNADPNQIAILKDAIYYGANIVECFSNSPPYYMTVSGCSSGGHDSGKNNILPESFDKFADYLAKVTAYIQNDLGIKVDSLSPMNEPNTDFWGYEGTQEGCHIDSKDHSALILATHKALQKYGLSNVAVVAADENNSDRMADYITNDYTQEALSCIPRFNAHSYGGSGRKIFEVAADMGKKLYMSEDDWAASIGHDAGNMGPAMWLSCKINSDMNAMRPNAWICWQITGPAPGGNSDSGYWYMSQYDKETNQLDLFKKYYAFAHYTKFIRQGDYILPANSDNVLAARNFDTGKTVVVVTNPGYRDENYEIDLSSFENLGNNITVYRTDKERDLELLSGGATLDGKILKAEIPVNSITTFVIENNSPAKVTNNGLTMSASALSCFEGESIQLKAVAANEADTILYSAQNGSVDQSGLFTASAPGMAQVKASIGETDIAAVKNISVLESGDVVRIVNLNSGLAVQEADGGFVQGGNNDSAYQYWRIYRIGDILSFVNLRSGNLLSDNGGTEWRLERGEGGYGLVNTATGKGLDAYGYNTDEGSTVGTYEYGGGSNQLWNFLLDPISPEVDQLMEPDADCRLIPTKIQGTEPYGGSQEVSFEKAFDGDVTTHHDAWDGSNSYLIADMPQDKPMTLLRYYPREGFDWRMFGGKFYGVKDGTETLLHTVPGVLKNGWNEVYLENDVIYDQIIYRTPEWGMCNVAEIEFYNVPYTASLSCDGSNVTLDIKSYTDTKDLRMAVIGWNKDEFPHSTVYDITLDKFSSRSFTAALDFNYERAYVYVMDESRIITSGYIYLQSIN